MSTTASPAATNNPPRKEDFASTSAAFLPEEEEQNETKQGVTCGDPSRTRTSTITTTTANSDNNDEEDEYAGLYADVGFLFEGSSERQPTRVETFDWNHHERNITVTLRVVVDHDNDGLPDYGATHSGHYLWPGARQLADFLVEQEQGNTSHNTAPTTVVELGAGCALLSCVALQLWQPTLECLAVTDQDAAALERARDNYETTVQALLDRSISEDDLNAAINATASISVEFCALTWGDDTRRLRAWLGEHATHKVRRADVILGSDLLYSTAVVQPLLQTAKDLLAVRGVFYLAQSYTVDANLEATITLACVSLGLTRQTLVQNEKIHIQAFTLRDELEYSSNSYDEGDHHNHSHSNHSTGSASHTNHQNNNNQSETSEETTNNNTQ